jgi:hypothetical protein
MRFPLEIFLSLIQMLSCILAQNAPVRDTGVRESYCVLHYRSEVCSLACDSVGFEVLTAVTIKKILPSEIQRFVIR